MSVIEPSRSERLRYWMINGSAAPATMTCAIGHQWMGSSRSSTHLFLARRRRWFWLPVDLLRMVHDSRSMVPVPITYVSAGVVGVLLGAVLDLVLGWPWWIVAASFVAAVWLFFLASALWGPGPVRGDDIRDVIDPQGAEARQFARLEEAILTGQLVGFEVASWTGSRFLGGWGGSSHPEQVTLRHGDPERDNRWVSVTTLCGRRAAFGSDWRKDHLFESLLRNEEQPPKDLDADDRHRWLVEQERRIEDAKRVEWSTTAMTVDGTPIPCDVLHRADRWVAMTVADGATIEVMARGFKVDTVALNRVQNLQPYMQGTQQLNAARRREHGH